MTQRWGCESDVMQTYVLLLAQNSMTVQTVCSAKPSVSCEIVLAFNGNLGSKAVGNQLF